MLPGATRILYFGVVRKSQRAWERRAGPVRCGGDDADGDDVEAEEEEYFDHRGCDSKCISNQTNIPPAGREKENIGVLAMCDHSSI